MRFSALLVLTGLLIGTVQADDSVDTNPIATPATDPAVVHQQMQQRREAWRALTPEQRQSRWQTVRTQAQTLRKQHNNQ